MLHGFGNTGFLPFHANADSLESNLGERGGKIKIKEIEEEWKDGGKKEKKSEWERGREEGEKEELTFFFFSLPLQWVGKKYRGQDRENREVQA